MQDITLFLQHHWMLSTAVVAVLILLTILEFIKGKTSTKRLSPQRAVQLMNHENAVIVDVRNPEAFANGHIVGSISLPFRDLETSHKKVEKFITAPIIVVCATGQDSQRAANALEKKGYNTYLLENGLRAWQQADMPLVKD